MEVLLDKKLIQPSRSAYSSPVIFISKPDGSLRMCVFVDYRALIQQTQKDKYPLPRIDDLLDKVTGASVFSSLDLQSGYHQIRVAEEDVPKTAFRTPQGLFEFQVLAFGLTNASADFQHEMNRIFGHLDFVLVYLDNVLAFSKDEKQHAQHLRQVLKLLESEHLYAKMSKCSFPSSLSIFYVMLSLLMGCMLTPAKSLQLLTGLALGMFLKCAHSLATAIISSTSYRVMQN